LFALTCNHTYTRLFYTGSAPRRFQTVFNHFFLNLSVIQQNKAIHRIIAY